MLVSGEMCLCNPSQGKDQMMENVVADIGANNIKYWQDKIKHSAGMKRRFPRKQLVNEN